MNIQDAQEMANRVLVSSATVKISDVKLIDPKEGLSKLAMESLKAISPGLVLSENDEVEFIAFAEAKVDTGGITTRNAAFKAPKKARTAVYALVKVGGRETRIQLEQLINPVTLTGISDADVKTSITDALEDSTCFQPAGPSSIAEVLGWIGQTKTVKHAVKNFSREVNASAGGEYEGKKTTITGLNAYWFSK